MKRNLPWYALCVLFALTASGEVSGADTKAASDKSGPEVVILKTSMGDIHIELYPDKAPVTVKNFLSYVDSGFYDGTVFHRVIKGFMIQGGGFTPGMKKKETLGPIKNEANNGLKNTRGSIAMARTRAVNSATSQFFINLTDNSFLDHGERDFGYAVFGQVVDGMDVVDAIAAVETGTSDMHRDVPVKPVVIQNALRKNEGQEQEKKK